MTILCLAVLSTHQPVVSRHISQRQPLRVFLIQNFAKILGPILGIIRRFWIQFQGTQNGRTKTTPVGSRTDSVDGEVVDLEKGIASLDNMSRTENNQIVTQNDGLSRDMFTCILI